LNLDRGKSPHSPTALACRHSEHYVRAKKALE
jgi:hypothetical protein